MARYLREAIPGSRLLLLAKERHLSILDDHVEEILSGAVRSVSLRAADAYESMAEFLDSSVPRSSRM